MWVADQMGIRHFKWQEGYGAFTVSASARETVRLYIGGQEAHHRAKSFREELIEFLTKSEAEFEEQYLD